MDNASRNTTAEGNRRLIEIGARPVLAHLPDISAELPVVRAAKATAAHSIGYRFDPPQAAGRGARAKDDEKAAQFRTLKSELIYAPRTSRPLQPHVFDRPRTSTQDRSSDRSSRRPSPILPRTNPFAIPRRSLFDSIAPAVRFVGLVVLFAAAGTWLQLGVLSNHPKNETAESPNTTAQQEAPARKPLDRPTRTPTAVGPVGSKPESGTRVGRVRDNDDFATLRGDIQPVPQGLAEQPNLSFPSLVGAGGATLPRVQTVELPKAGTGEATRSDSDPSPTRQAEVARMPGFSIEIPAK